MSEIKVNSIKGVGASTAAITVDNSSGSASANLTTVNSVTMPNGGFLSNRNLIINGAMQVAQRGTSFTASSSFPVDRFKIDDGGHDELSTKEQAAVTSGGAYDSGFRKCIKITNGNQTSGAGASDYVQIMTRIEAQDIANSGWNYKSSSSFITFSFWVKSSVPQVFSGSLRTADGTSYSYKFDTPSLSTDTWTKVTKTISGNSNLTFDDNVDLGLQIFIFPFIGTTYTTANSDTETWVTASGGNYANNMTSTWWTTNDATFEITGVQLEVGSVATDFEHRTFADELLKCARYCYVVTRLPAMSNAVSGYVSCCSRPNPVPMRASPSLSKSGGITFNPFFVGSTHITYVSPSLQAAVNDNFVINFSGFSSTPVNNFGDVSGFNYLIMSAEL